MSPVLLHQPLTSAAVCAELAGDADYERLDFDDGTLRIRGTLPPAAYESLLLTHVEGGCDSDGRVIWYPKEADNDS